MMRRLTSLSGSRLSAIAGVLVWALATSAGCAVAAGLTGSSDAACVGICDSGADGSSAAVDGSSSGSSQPPGDATSSDMLDSSQTPSDDAASESAVEGPGPDATAVDSTPEGAGPPRDGGLDGSAGARDAQPDAARPKCGSGILAPTTAVASSVTSPNVAAFAIDGLLTTRWESLWADPQTIDVDFGAPVFIGEVDVLWEAACAKNYDLEVSMDGAAWTTIQNGTISGNTLAANAVANPPSPPTDWSKAVVTKPLSAVGRHLRVHGTVRCTVYGYSIWEMRAYGDRNAACMP